MKVLLAGATGAIGIPITRQLLANGHQVLGLTREPAGSRPSARPTRSSTSSPPSASPRSATAAWP
jgi:nucleoside-diphosphate-sugar epimerase